MWSHMDREMRTICSCGMNNLKLPEVTEKMKSNRQKMATLTKKNIFTNRLVISHSGNYSIHCEFFFHSK